MLKKAGIIIALVLALPGFANAWTVVGKIASGKGTLAASGATSKVFGAFSSHQPVNPPEQFYRVVRTGDVAVAGYFRATDAVRDPFTGAVTTPAAPSQLLQVTESNPSYKVAMVVLDGQQIGQAAGAYTIPYNGKSLRSLAVYFTRGTYSIVLDKPQLGYVSIQRVSAEHGSPVGLAVYPAKLQATDTVWKSRMQGLLPGQWVRVTAVPNLDCQVTRVAGGNDIATDSSLVGIPISRDVQITGDLTESDLPSSITLNRWVKAYLFGSNTITTVDVPVVLETRASTNDTNNISEFQLNWSATCGTLTDLAPAVHGKKLFTSGAAGTCTVSVTATKDGATSPAATDTIKVITEAASANMVCLSCHTNRNQTLVSSFDASGHAAKGLTCLSCHNPESGPAHYGLAADYSKEGSGGVCFQCHRGTDTPAFNGIRHFSDSAQSSYVGNAGRPRNVCASCHFRFDPHGIGNNPEGLASFAANGQQLADWAASPHGRLDGAFRSPVGGPQFSTSGNSGSTAGVTPANSATAGQCVRCHTAAGYIQFVTETPGKPAFTNISAVAPAADGVTTFDDSSPLLCSACHRVDPRGSTVPETRAIPPALGFYNVSTLATGKVLTVHEYRSLGQSDLCMPCHTGYGGNGEAVSRVFDKGNDYHGPVLVSHLGAAGMTVTSYGAYEYENYSGIQNSHLLTGSDGRGPCVGCHMTTPGRSHALSAVDADGDAVSGACLDCHGAGGMNVAAARAKFAAALAVLKTGLESRGLPTAAGVTPTAWGADAATSARNMGASYNYLLYDVADPAAYVHNPLYAKRAVYDAISWLVNGTRPPGQPGYVTIDEAYIDSQSSR